MAQISMKEMLEAGVHFGHKSANWNPRMSKYIVMKRKGVHIIDLQKTLALMDEAYNYVRNTVANGGDVLFVGTKKQAKAAIEEHAARCNMPYISKHWIGGLLTNHKVVRQSIKKLQKLNTLLESEEAQNEYTKKELIRFSKKRDKLQKSFGGVIDMKKMPKLMFVIDAGFEQTAIEEAHKLHIPVAALVDTNSNPDLVDICIPGNDDAIRAVNLFVKYMANAVEEGLSMRPDFEGNVGENARTDEGGEAEDISEAPAESTVPEQSPTVESPAENPVEEHDEKHDIKEHNKDHSDLENAEKAEEN